MEQPHSITCTAFEGVRHIATGDLFQVVLQTKEVIDRGTEEPVLIFDNRTSRVIDVDFRGSAEEILQRLDPSRHLGISPIASPSSAEENPLASSRPKTPGRPKLGVVAREVTLLPRHWEWLNRQPGGASVALRKLVDEARHAHEDRDRLRESQDNTYRFMLAMAGNQPGFEEATRALFAGQAERFSQLIESWPRDIRDHIQKLAASVFENSTEG